MSHRHRQSDMCDCQSSLFEPVDSKALCQCEIFQGFWTIALCSYAIIIIFMSILFWQILDRKILKRQAEHRSKMTLIQEPKASRFYQIRQTSWVRIDQEVHVMIARKSTLSILLSTQQHADSLYLKQEPMHELVKGQACSSINTWKLLWQLSSHLIKATWIRLLKPWMSSALDQEEWNQIIHTLLC